MVARSLAGLITSQQMQSSWRRMLGDSTKGHCYISCYVWYLCLIRTWEIQQKDEEPPGGCVGGGHVCYRKRKCNYMSASCTLVLVLLFVNDTLKEEMEETELAARVANMGSTHLPPLCPFVARQTSPTQRDWIVNSDASAHMCCKRNQFSLNHALWPPHLIWPRIGKTVSALDAGDILNQAPMPSIAGDSTLCETFTKNRLSVRKRCALKSRAHRDVPNVKRPGDESRTPN